MRSGRQLPMERTLRRPRRCRVVQRWASPSCLPGLSLQEGYTSCGLQIAFKSIIKMHDRYQSS
jgi:hypothetical protein